MTLIKRFIYITCLGFSSILFAQAPTMPQVKITSTTIRLSPELASKWGLDGGPAEDPKATPLAKDIPSVLSFEEHRKIFAAIRKNKDSKIMGTNTVIVHSGIETYTSKSYEARFIESFDGGDIIDSTDQVLEKTKEGTEKLEQILELVGPLQDRLYFYSKAGYYI